MEIESTIDRSDESDEKWVPKNDESVSFSLTGTWTAKKPRLKSFGDNHTLMVPLKRNNRLEAGTIRWSNDNFRDVQRSFTNFYIPFKILVHIRGAHAEPIFNLIRLCVISRSRSSWWQSSSWLVVNHRSLETRNTESLNWDNFVYQCIANLSCRYNKSLLLKLREELRSLMSIFITEISWL